MAWNHGELLRLVPYEQPDTFNEGGAKVAIAVMFKDRQGPQGTAIPATAELMAPYSGIATDARRLIFAAPLMYQTLSATAQLMRGMIDEISNMVDKGIMRDTDLVPVIMAYEQVERECLTAMQVATTGISATAASFKKGV